MYGEVVFLEERWAISLPLDGRNKTNPIALLSADFRPKLGRIKLQLFKFKSRLIRESPCTIQIQYKYNFYISKDLRDLKILSDSHQIYVNYVTNDQ